ncbi:ROK family protein [Anaerobacillus isosaccharinicus]|uniref:ROK family protein n=1 Tax=Anaerobacillus isosaccharinicus TaxID=1532552 RepID=A0A7S7RCN3_9BACI|nr:ROK family protein [Anaerobacillus isosaccharinicus]MBA5584485.1 ROK family protein [Anaerobacillus isosaccharinicus]QOY37131.1 ROK family protein [Anaerobacillus isosaccharinicus]
MEYSIGVDIGGTKILAGIVSRGGEVLYKQKVPTPKMGRNDILQELKELIENLTQWASLNDITLQGIGIGTAGQVNPFEGKILSGTANINNWGDIYLQQEVNSYSDLPVYVDNDVNVLTLAEAELGAAKGYHEVLCLALGTGVGGGIISKGELLRGAWGGAAELGHMTINFDGEQCNCGFRGCLETYASGPWIAKRMNDLRNAVKGNKEAVVSLTSEEVFRFYHLGDPFATKVVQTMIRGLATGVVNLIHIFNPQIVVLGGGVMYDGQWIIDLVKQEIQSLGIRTLVDDVKIELSNLSNDSGLIGAALQTWVNGR